MTQKTNQNPWTMDVRVRERNLKSGALTDKDVEKHLAALPDLADQTESFGTCQPALAQPVVVAPPPPPPAAAAHMAMPAAEMESAPLDDDDDDDDLDSDQGEGAALDAGAGEPEVAHDVPAPVEPSGDVNGEGQP